MGKVLSLAQIGEIAAMLNCEPAVVRAVIHVETAGPGYGFIPIILSGESIDHPVVLFERHIFCRLTNPDPEDVTFRKHPLVKSHPYLCNPKPGGYAQGRSIAVRREKEIERLYRAAALDPKAAFQSASWGLPQIMGFNYETCGCDSVEEFVSQMKIDEFAQMKLFVAFLQRLNLDDLLRDKNWEGFARWYNGSAYKENRYHSRLATAYKQLKGVT
jgi:hypothetical protein